MLLAAEGRSTRSIAEDVGVQPRIVSNWRRRLADHGLAGLEDGPLEAPNVLNINREHNIDLAARKPWCESNDPAFAAKVADVVGLYIDPRAKAIVLSVDEKPSIQALERAQGSI